MHFGLPPRFKKDVKVIQLDVDPTEAHNNLRSDVALMGDAKAILGQLSEAVKSPLISRESAWWKKMDELCKKNEKGAAQMMANKNIPMNYYAPLKIIEDKIQTLKEDYIIVSEGSNTMDIGRTILTNNKALQRLDAGTFGTMGVGFGFAIAAQALHKNKKVVMVVGDSAFGFSGMEIETASRYNMPLKVIVINNNGISMGAEEKSKDDNALTLPVTHLNPESKYEMVSQAFGGKGREVKTHQELEKTLEEAL